ncbi:MAG: PqqD family protein [Candidatus Cardinium sp.]|nr:PqqD family protein [Candidatus Cardinium sp.]
MHQSIITADSILKYASNIQWRNYLKGIVIEPEIALNITAAFIFLQINGEDSIATIAGKLSKQYNISNQEACDDVIMIVTRLIEDNILHLVK